jgi:hypothetical protein
MIRNYFKVAWRNLIKSKGYSLINIGGLAGMAVAILIGLWIYDELVLTDIMEITVGCTSNAKPDFQWYKELKIHTLSDC